MARIGRARLASLAAALAAGCAVAPPDVAGAKQSWLGTGYDDVVLRWGAPARSTTLTDGRVAHTWSNEYTTHRGYFYPSVGVFGSRGNVGVGVGVGTDIPFGAEQRRCERTLVFAEGKVAEQSWSGPDEYCETFKKR